MELQALQKYEYRYVFKQVNFFAVMEKKVKIIATIGPASNNEVILSSLKDRGVDFFRINLSHTNEEDIEKRIKEILPYNVPIILDTEGSQIRSGNTKEIEFKEGEEIKLYDKKINCDSNSLFFEPAEVIGNFNVGDLISIDFNSVLLKVFSTSNLPNKGFIECKIIIGGIVGGKKATHVDSPKFSLPPFSKKDLIALDLGKKYGIKNFTLSFMESPESVKQFRSLYPNAIIYSKIESKKGLDNFVEIARESDGILIDRGDLSYQVPIEKIPFVQKYVINKCRQMEKKVFVATNTLEAMSSSLKPNRAEVNDIINTLLDGATGIALTKEIATGNHPIETVNMLNALIKQLDFLKIDGENTSKQDIFKNIERYSYLGSKQVPGLLVQPHGGVLVDRISKKKYASSELPQKRIFINEETLMDVEQISIGSFSPLEGFLSEKDFNSVLETMRLSSGIVWPIPVVLAVNEETKNRLSVGEDVSLVYEKDNETYALLHLEEIYKIDKENAAKKIYGTSDLSHPGVKNFISGGEFFLGGKVTLLKQRESSHKIHELTPSQTRRIFSERGWSKVLGFHTRNVIHKSHEFIQIKGLNQHFCDGLFIHPVIGKKKSGDFESGVIIDCYEKMIENFYPSSKILFSSLATFSRYAGPREALFTALVRKNFGCSHFIIGRDHTGVKDFYAPTASHEIFDKFPSEDIGIIPVKFGKVFYSTLEQKYLHEPDFPDHPEEKKMHISGERARAMLKEGIAPPDWFMRPEISKIILEKIQNNESVFVK